MNPAKRFPPLALLDWGIGGLGVRAELRRASPGLAITYVSDSGAAPYGKLDARTLEARLGAVIAVLATKGVERVFLACNAASTTLERGTRHALPVLGMIEPGVSAVLASGARRVGVVGGRRTITSGVYRRALEAHGLEVRQRIAQPLSAAIEAGRADHEETAELVRRIAAPLRSVEALLLACTHYPAATAAFAAALPGVTLVDPAALAAATILRSWPSYSAAGEIGEDLVLTTGEEDAMRRSARRAFGMGLGRVQRLEVG